MMTAQCEFLILLIFKLLLKEVVANAIIEPQCDRRSLNDIRHILTSPNYPNPYPTGTECAWNVTRTDDVRITILITEVDIETEVNRDKNCCSDNSLIISDGDKVSKKFCGRFQFFHEPLAFPPSNTTIKISFKTTINIKSHGFRLILHKRNRSVCENFHFSCLDESGCYNYDDICDSNFKCSDHSDEINCANYQNGRTNCNSYSNYHFESLHERCDGIKQCPDGEDEIGCDKLCKFRIPCNNGRGCYLKNEICDGKLQCEDKSDELNCTEKLCGGQAYFLCNNYKCINVTLMNNGLDDCGDHSDEVLYRRNLGFLNLLLCITILLSFCFFGIVLRWYGTRRDIRYFMNNYMPQFPMPQFRAPDENRVGCLIQYSEADFLNGGEIYEAYVRSRRRPRILSSRYINVIGYGHMQREVVRNHDDTCGAMALVSLGINCMGDITQLCENCQKKENGNTNFNSVDCVEKSTLSSLESS